MTDHMIGTLPEELSRRTRADFRVERETALEDWSGCVACQVRVRVPGRRRRGPGPDRVQEQAGNLAPSL
jgi:hypothetical protein